jgi:cell fate regulator YaaT (PSP1 superfamily)
MSKSVLVRYGAISEVSRFVNASGTRHGRGSEVVVHSHRGVEIGTLLEDAPSESEPTPGDEGDDTQAGTARILRALTDEDRRTGQSHRSDCEEQYTRWQARIREWNLKLELIDLEWTLDRSKLILYVLNDRGPECTRLALQAVAAGLGIIEVQSVGPDGLVPAESGHGCGSGGCGSGGGSNGCCH